MAVFFMSNINPISKKWNKTRKASHALLLDNDNYEKRNMDEIINLLESRKGYAIQQNTRLKIKDWK